MKIDSKVFSSIIFKLEHMPKISFFLCTKLLHHLHYFCEDSTNTVNVKRTSYKLQLSSQKTNLKPATVTFS